MGTADWPAWSAMTAVVLTSATQSKHGSTLTGAGFGQVLVLWQQSWDGVFCVGQAAFTGTASVADSSAKRTRVSIRLYCRTSALLAERVAGFDGTLLQAAV